MQIRAVTLFSDNYAWLVFDEERGRGVVVDPGVAGPVLERARSMEIRLLAALLTDHHSDHTGGLAGLLDAIPDLICIGSANDRVRVPAINRPVIDRDRLELLGEEVRCLGVPGHARGATAYYWPASGMLFTGDTLSLGGCGRLIEGTAQELYASLSRLAALPESTLVYCGHEHTEMNLRFAAQLEPGNEAIIHRLGRAQCSRRAGLPTVPAPLREELETNPFLRTRAPWLQELAASHNEVEVFAELRRRRDRF